MRSKTRNTRRNRRTNRRIVKRRGGGSWTDIRGDLPTRTFPMGTQFFKGSMPKDKTCEKVLNYHLKTQKENAGKSSMDTDCTNGTSIFLGPSEERSKQYYVKGKNAWLVFKLKKDLTLLDITPENLKRDHMRILVDKAVTNHPEIENYLYNLKSFGGLSNLCLDGLPGQTWHDWRSRLVQAGKERTNMRICNTDFKERLTELFCLIFGIEKTVYEQKQFLLELANLERDFLFNSSRSGWTATPVLQRIKKTKLYDFVIYFLSCNKPGDNDHMANQRLSYYGFDMIFLTTVCAAGYPGYYYPERKSVHDDAGEEVALFRTNEYLECVSK